ncbi:MAG: extracellular solute-binding protein [Clostridia bacterium]|nr:extracellular solute-binding protein [Clostridia bacterium]
MFNRNALVGDNLNVTFSEEIVGWGDVAGVITNMVAADDPTYDIVFDEVQASIKYPANGQVLNLYSVEGLDFSKPWWDAGSVETLSVGDSLYMVNGDLHLMYGESAWVLFFNQNMLSEYNLESPYTVIKEGRWTFDKMHEMVSQVALDLNGDGVLNSDDQFGLATHSDFSLVLLTSAGEGLLYKNENNIPEWADLPEKVFDISQKTHNQFFDLNIAFQAYLSPKGTETTDIVPHFMAGKSLFLCEVLGHAKTLRDMEDNFGILPTPKYDEAQEDYNTFIARSAQTLMIPVTNRELPRTAVILENLGAESFKSLRPAYYDVQLSGKTARDADSLEMLDIIFEGRRYEMAYIFGANNVGSAYISSTETGSELASAVTKVSKAVKKVMEKTLAGLIGE